MNIFNFKELVLNDLMKVENLIHNIYIEFCKDFNNFVLFDGGAHKGWHTSRMASIKGCQLVYAVEADPFIYNTCSENLKKIMGESFNKIKLINSALQNDPNKKTIEWNSSFTHVGRSSIISNNNNKPTIWTGNKDVLYRQVQKVQSTTIDKILSDETRALPFIKLDLEGADLLSLFGANKTLQEKRPLIAFENSIHAPNVHNFSIDEVVEFFYKLNYLPINFVGEKLNKDNWFDFFEAWAVPAEFLVWLSNNLKKEINQL